MLGDLSAGAISSLYYPAADRHGAGLTLAEGFLNIGGDALGNVVQEFLFKRLTPHAPKYDTAARPGVKRTADRIWLTVPGLAWPR